MTGCWYTLMAVPLAGREQRRDVMVVSDDAIREAYYAQLVEKQSTGAVLAALREVAAWSLFCLACARKSKSGRPLEISD